MRLTSTCPVFFLLATAIGGVSGLAATGCASLYNLDDYRASEQNDPAKNAGDASTPTLANQTVPECTQNHECNVDSATAAVCVDQKCVALTTAECPRLYGSVADDTVVIGALLGTGADSAVERATALAASELNQVASTPTASSAGARSIIVLACDTSSTSNATKHLVNELKVSAMIGPLSGEDVIDVTQKYSARGGTLLFAPGSTASSITNLADNDLTWRGVPSDSQRAKLVIQQTNDLETLLRNTRSLSSVKLGVVHANDAAGNSFNDSISGKLILNGRFISDPANAGNVSLDAYPANDASAASAIVANYADSFHPDMVFVTSAEQITSVIVPLETALTAAHATAHPYYIVTEAVKTADLLAVFSDASMPLDLKRRVRGIGVKADAPSAPIHASFDAAYNARYGAPATTTAAAAAYDALYSITYALAAAPADKPTGASIARGLRAIGVGEAASVGADGVRQILQDIGAGRSIALRGTNGLMAWDANGDIASGTLEVWCVGGSSGAFGSSGLSMDVATQVVGGAFVQCQ